MDLPKIEEGLLDDAGLDALFFDVRHAARLLEVVDRGAGPAGDPRPVDDPDRALVDARDALRSGRAVQLRYRFGGSEWWDTLIPLATGTRVVRIDRNAIMR
jgi:hypothetical protein